MLINLYCGVCGKKHTMDVKKTQYDAYIAGEFLDIAFNDLSLINRKVISTGMCENCIQLKYKNQK
jgi:hypothetical protein